LQLRERAAFALPSTLAVTGFCLLGAMVLAATWLCHLNLSRAVDSHLRSQNLADSLASLAAALIIDSGGNFGASSLPTLQLTNAAGDQAMLTFDSKATYRGRSAAWSVNNLGNDASVPGCGRQVPAYNADLLSTSVSGYGSNVTEVMLHLPPFPYAIAASGRVGSAGGLLVGGVAGQSSLPPNLASLLPSDLVSNDTSQQAVVVQPTARITGDVKACGGITVPPGSVLGQIDAGMSSPVALPQMDLTQYDPALMGVNYQSIPSGTIGPTVLEYFCRVDGPLTITGDLQLDNAELYVNGPLTIQGTIQGTGAVVTTGSVAIQKGASLQASNVIAVGSQSDIVLGGTSQSTDAFRGLIYTQGNFKAQDITLMGCFIANGSGGGAGRMGLSQDNVVYVPEFTDISFPVTSPPSPGPSPGPPTLNLFLPALPNTIAKLQITGQPDSNPAAFDLQSRTGSESLTGGSHGLSYGPWAPSQVTLPMTPSVPPAIMNQIKYNLMLLSPAAQQSFVNRLGNSIATWVNGQSGGGSSGGGGGGGGGGNVTIVTMDLKQFLSLSDSIRLLLWKSW
jgi:hypothetical protein